MKHKLLLTTFLLISKFLIGQSVNRIEVNGVIYANTNDVEAVTVYNKSSNKGTITNEKGEFVLLVAENDIIEISALQFEAQKVTITKEVIESKLLRIYLLEQVNQLNAVLLYDGLTGNIVADIENVEIPPKIQIDLGNMDAMEFFDDKAFDNSGLERELEALTIKGRFYNGIDFIKIKNMLFKPKKRTYPDDNPKYEKPKLLIDVYSLKFIGETFNIPSERVNEFVAFVENNGIPQEVLDGKHEFELIDFLVKQSELFLKE